VFRALDAHDDDLGLLASAELAMSPPNQQAESGHVLNIVPVSFSKETVRLGRIQFIDDDHYHGLLTSTRATHVLRFDHRDGTIANVSIRRGVMPLVVISDDEPVQAHLSLMGKLLQHFLLEWLQQGRTILRKSRPIIFRAGNKAGVSPYKAYFGRPTSSTRVG
jgi:hypothetical protein